MIASVDLIDAARSELGTRFRHQGRLGGVSLDCSGLCVVSCRKCGIDLSFADRNDYPRVPDGQAFVRALRVALLEIDVDDARPGDWLVFWLTARQSGSYNWPQHMALLTETDPRPRIIHAVAERRKVVEHDLRAPYRQSFWWDELVSHAFRVPGIKVDRSSPALGEAFRKAR